MKIQAKIFKNRNTLEKYLRAVCGENPQKNKEEQHLIEGTRAELEKLQLSDTTTVFGIPCVITDKPTKIEIENQI